MKDQTFGVEIEMYNIRRADAAKLVANFFETNLYQHNGGTYDIWSAIDQQGRKWKFMSDSSIDDSYERRCEMVTPILKYDDIEFLQEIVRQLRHAGAKSNALHNCGVHIHIGAEGHTAQSLRNLTNLMASHEDLIHDAIRIDDRRSFYCKSVDQRFLKQLNDVKPQTMSGLADVWYKSQNCDDCRSEHYNSSRYHMLNLHATFTKGTVEFRMFQFDLPENNSKGGLHAGKLKAYIQFCMAISDFAKRVSKASPKKVQMDNPKFAMRTWLVRMGMIGDEFKTAREQLTRNLNGDMAFRNGRVAV